MHASRGYMRKKAEVLAGYCSVCCFWQSPYLEKALLSVALMRAELET